MSDLDVGSISTVRGVDPEQCAMAMRAVAANSRDGQDCLLMLRALGLVPDPEAKPRRKGRS